MTRTNQFRASDYATPTVNQLLERTAAVAVYTINLMKSFTEFAKLAATSGRSSCFS